MRHADNNLRSILLEQLSHLCALFAGGNTGQQVLHHRQFSEALPFCWNQQRAITSDLS